MTPEAQRIAIAEACGWRGVYSTSLWNNAPTGIPPSHEGDLNDVHARRILPNYLSDLNAMHEAEKVCIYKYGPYSNMALEYEGYLHVCCDSSIVHIAASQRAEAFLRTLNLWDDTK
jgi:hypothetical protein